MLHQLLRGSIIVASFIALGSVAPAWATEEPVPGVTPPGFTPPEEQPPDFLETVFAQERQRQVAEQYSADAGISVEEALRRLTVQQQANGLTLKAKELLGNEFGGVWFDRESGDVVVGITSESLRPAVERLIEEHVASDDGRARLVRSSRADLEAAQAVINAELAERRRGIAWTGIDDSTNRVVIGLGIESSAADLEWANGLSASFARGRNADSVPGFPLGGPDQTGSSMRVVDVEVRQLPTSARGETRACVGNHCGSPLRAGVGIRSSYDGNSAICTSGYYGRRWDGTRFTMYAMTAGHCLNGRPGTWFAYHQPLGRWEAIGPRGHWRYGSQYGSNPPGGSVWADIGVIRVEENPVSVWYTTATARLVMWGWPSASWDFWGVLGQDIANVGRYGCRSGITTSFTCGHVSIQSVSQDYFYRYTYESTINNLFVVPGACSAGGDSGGPFIDGGTALGIVSGGPQNGTCETWFVHVIEADWHFGVRVAA